MLVQKGRTIFSIFFKEKTLFMKMRNSCMFSKLSEMTIFRSCTFHVIFIGNFGDSRYLALKIIVLVQIQVSPPSTLANTQFIMHNSSDITKLYNLQTSCQSFANVTKFYDPAEALFFLMVSHLPELVCSLLIKI